MAWSTCPPDVLAKCLKLQQDYVDNSAAACACTSWRDTFRGCAEEIRLQHNPINQTLLPSTYLRQFKGLRTVEVAIGPEWAQQDSASWLTAGDVVPQRGLYGEGLWTETVRSIPASCCWLKLDSLLPFLMISRYSSTFSHYFNLRSLYIYTHHEAVIHVDTFASLPRLQLLSLVTRPSQPSGRVTVDGSLKDLPNSITNLQLSHCCILRDLCLLQLPYVPHITSLELSSCTVSFGDTSEVADLHQLKVLVLDGVLAKCPEPVVASLMTATQLQDLNLRNFTITNGEEGPIAVLQLGALLPSLQSLQKLDVTSCRHVQLGPSEYTQLRLHSFACHYRQLNIVEAMPFQTFSQPFQTSDGSRVWPTLQVEGQFPHFGHQHWINTLPMTALTRLTIQTAHVWPLPLLLDSKGQALPNLLYLDISFASLVSTSRAISFPVGSKLQELYLAGTSCDDIYLADCTSLTSLGVLHRGFVLQHLHLPTSLERLYIHNVLKAYMNPCLSLLTNLKYIKVGGRAATKGIMKCLPDLPPSLPNLDLWDGVVTNLDQLTLLTRLKKLTMPLAPSPQQLSIIKQLRQLRHIEVTTHEGKGACRCRSECIARTFKLQMHLHDAPPVICRCIRHSPIIATAAARLHFQVLLVLQAFIADSHCES